MTQAVPGQRWTFQSVQFAARPIRLTFDYTFRQRDGKTLVTRTMDTVAASYADLTDVAQALYERHGFAVESQDAVDVFMVRYPR